MIDVELEVILFEVAVHDPECEKCERVTVTMGQWKAADAEEREELRVEGYAEPGGRGLCRDCYRTTPTDELPPRRLSAEADRGVRQERRVRTLALIANRDELMARGWTVEEASSWLGENVDRLERAKVRLGVAA